MYCHSSPNLFFQASLEAGISPESSIPAAAHDLYPLIINMVGSHAKSTDDLAKFWVVQLGEQQTRRHCHLEPELRACKAFCLMKDLIKLCKNLQMHRVDGQKTLDPKCWSGIEKSALKLREAVENLDTLQLGMSSDVESLKSVATTFWAFYFIFFHTKKSHLFVLCSWLTCAYFIQTGSLQNAFMTLNMFKLYTAIIYMFTASLCSSKHVIVHF